MAEGNLSSETPPDVTGDQPRRVPEASAARDDRPATGAAMETLAALKTLEAHRSSLRPVVVSSPDCRSFSQLLAGAMASPVGSPAAVPAILSVPVDGVRLPMVAVPCFVAPASPGFAGQFAMTHQAVLATVTAQAQMQMHANAMHPPSSELSTNTFSQQILSTISPLPLQQRPPHSHEDSPCSLDQKPKSAQTVVNTNPVGDGYNWRKYGQKQVKGSENSRSYYKCTSPNCLAKKKVERCPDGPAIEVYRGQHNHDPPQQTRCSRERGPRSSVTLGESDGADIQNTEIHSLDFSNAKMDQTFGNGIGTPEQQLFCSSDCEGDAGIKTEEELGNEPESKRRLMENIVTCSAPSPRIFREHKIVVQAESDAGRAGDGYKWRKYGQKLVKGNPNPRSYYRCTHNGCPVRKHVERASDDEKAIIITYEGKHNHDQPGPKNSSDPPPPSPLPPVAAVMPDEQSHPSDNSSDTKISVLLLTDIKGGSTLEKAPGLERERALDSAQALVTIGLNSTSGDNDEGTNSDGVKSTVVVENHTINSIEGS